MKFVLFSWDTGHHKWPRGKLCDLGIYKYINLPPLHYYSVNQRWQILHLITALFIQTSPEGNYPWCWNFK